MSKGNNILMSLRVALRRHEATFSGEEKTVNGLLFATVDCFVGISALSCLNPPRNDICRLCWDV
jgi:hypothetical protein